MSDAPELFVGPKLVDVDKPPVHDERYWSVTTIVGILGSEAIKWWIAEKVARAAVESRETWQAMERENGTAEAVDWLKRARFRPPRGELTDADFGTEVHNLCERFVIDGIRPTPSPDVFHHPKDLERAGLCLDQFSRWLDDFQPVFEAAEVTVYNRTYGYAGQADTFLSIEDVRFVGDYKVSKEPFDKKGKPKPIYPETALQLVAYARAELAAVWRPRRFESFRRRYYLLSREENAAAVAVPATTHGLGLKITPEYVHAYPLAIDDEVWASFLYILEGARWQFETSKRVVGEPLVSPKAAA